MTPAALRLYTLAKCNLLSLADRPMLTKEEQALLRLGEQEIDAVMDKRYGQKGGDGPNTGKKASKYRVELPDGTVQYKRSFTCREQEAVAGYFKLKDTDELYIGGIWPSEQAFIDAHGETCGYTFIKAVKV